MTISISLELSEAASTLIPSLKIMISGQTVFLLHGQWHKVASQSQLLITLYTLAREANFFVAAVIYTQKTNLPTVILNYLIQFLEKIENTLLLDEGVWRALVHSEKLIKNSRKKFAYFEKFRQLTFNGSHFNFLILDHGLFCTGRKTLEIPTDSSSRSPKSDFLFPQGPAKPRQMVFLNIQLFQICDTPNGFSRREMGLFEVWKTPKLYAISLLHMPVRTWQYYIGSPTWVLIHLLLKSRAVVPRL